MKDPKAHATRLISNMSTKPSPLASEDVEDAEVTNCIPPRKESKRTRK